jgi:hypothetical protein
MKQILALAALLLSMPSGAWSQAAAPEALPDAANYPDPQCRKPQVDRINKPQTHYDAGGFDAGAVGSYNSRVKVFNKEAGAYNSCMHAYIDKANGDVKRIQEKANADLKQIGDRANASMKIVQDKIRQAAADANSVATAMDEETAKLRKQ